MPADCYCPNRSYSRSSMLVCHKCGKRLVKTSSKFWTCADCDTKLMTREQAEAKAKLLQKQEIKERRRREADLPACYDTKIGVRVEGQDGIWINTVREAEGAIEVFVVGEGRTKFVRRLTKEEFMRLAYKDVDTE